MKPWHLYRPQQFFTRTLAYLSSDPVVRVRLPYGLRIEVDRSEGVGRSIVRRGTHDLPVAEIIHRLLRPGDCAVDLGANIGFFTQLMSARVGAQGRVWGYEPHPSIFARLQRNVGFAVEALGYANVRAIQKAISHQPGHATLEMPDDFETNQGLSRISTGPSSTTRRTLNVECSTLDHELGQTPIRLMKMDVEGHELQALEGAGRLLGTGAVRHLVFEDHSGADSPVIRCLQRHGYTVKRLGWHLHGPRLGELADLSVVKPPEPPNFIASLAMDEVAEACRPRGWRVL